MTKEIKELQSWLELHPTDFGSQIALKHLIRAYGEELNDQQEAEFKALGY